MLHISLIIPTFERPARLAECLASLTETSHPAEALEVIVVDDGGRVPLDPVLAAFGDRLQTRLVRQTNAGPAAARNRGALEARHPLLAFTDDDCRPASGWLSELAKTAEQFPDAMIGGSTANALADNVYSAASQRLIDYICEYYQPGSGRTPFFASNNMAVPAHRFHEVGGFDPSFPLAAGEDRDFCRRWYEAGFPMVAAPHAVIEHAHRLSLASFWRQHVNYGRGAYHYQGKRHPPARPQRPEPISFYLDLVTHPLRAKSGEKRLREAALLAVSQIANVGGYTYEYLLAASGRR